MNRSALVSFSATLAAAALVAGCAAPASLPTAPAPAAGPATTGGKSIIIAKVEEPETLNPYITQLVTSIDVLSGVMEGLMDFDTNQVLRPQLAESYSISDDGLTYTFKLRRGVKWHDGQPFGAADVVATWKIIMNPDFAAFSQLGWDKIAEIETPDDHTVVMKTSERYAPFLSYVATTFISPKHLIDKGVDAFKQEFGRRPIGTGPYKFTRWETGQFIELEKFADYWAGAPKLDKVIIKIVPDDNTLMVQLTTGEVQLTDAVSAARIEEARRLPNSVVLTRNGLEWTHMDLKNIGFLMDKRVRQALDYATPKQQIIDRLLGGLATISIGDQAPGTPYFNPNIKPRPYDLEAAARLLEEAGFKKSAQGILEKDGQPFVIEHWIVAGDQLNKQIQQVIAASWRQLGIDVQEREEDIKTIWGPNGYQFTQAMTAALYSWTNANDPDDMFYWHSSQIPPDPTGTGGNLPAYFNQYEQQAKIDELTAAGAAEVNPEKRKQIYWQIQELLFEETPVIFMYWPQRIYVAPRNLTGFNPNTFNFLLWDVEKWDFEN
ncbi:MAG: peptide ABC transporter substrate-binding protein [Anaerolineae bacterium]|nr:peptide ABC transporter substrate-binding protein [Anaerolineae bacterium]